MAASVMAAPIPMSVTNGDTEDSGAIYRAAVSAVMLPTWRRCPGPGLPFPELCRPCSVMGAAPKLRGTHHRLTSTMTPATDERPCVPGALIKRACATARAIVTSGVYTVCLVAGSWRPRGMAPPVYRRRHSVIGELSPSAGLPCILLLQPRLERLEIRYQRRAIHLTRARECFEGVRPGFACSHLKHRDEFLSYVLIVVD